MIKFVGDCCNISGAIAISDHNALDVRNETKVMFFLEKYCINFAPGISVITAAMYGIAAINPICLFVAPRTRTNAVRKNIVKLS